MNRRIDNIIDMLEGNICRMCVTDSKEELLQMYTYANIRLNEIFVDSSKRIKDQNISNDYSSLINARFDR